MRNITIDLWHLNVHRMIGYTDIMKRIRSIALGLIAFIMPLFVFAQNYIGSGSNGTAWGSIKEIVEAVGKFINTTVMPIIVSLGVLYFLWNIAQYITKLDNEKERENFKRYSINGILGLFIMLSLWAIIAIGTNTLFGSQPVVPQFRTSSSGSGTGAPQ